jgi:tetratricopeptide (TPR) repeat protein
LDGKVMIHPDRLKAVLSVLRSSIQESIRTNDESLVEETIDAAVAELLIDISDADQHDGFTRHASLVLRTFEEMGLPDIEPGLIGEIVQGIGKTYERLGDTPSAGEAYTRALKLADDAGDEVLAAGCRRRMGRVLTGTADLSSAEELLQTSLATYESIDDKTGIAQTLCDLGVLYFQRGEVDEAEKTYLRALTFSDDIGDPTLSVSLHNNLGVIADVRGDTDSAINQYDAGVTLAERSGDEALLAEAYLNLGTIREKAEDWSGANQMFGLALDLARSNGAGRIIGAAHLGKSLVYIGVSDLAQAAVSCGKALSIYSSVNDKIGQAKCYRVLGDIFARRGDSVPALKMLNQSISISQLSRASLEAATSQRTMGLIYERLEQNAEAADSFVEAISGFDTCGAQRDKLQTEADLARVSA